MKRILNTLFTHRFTRGALLIGVLCWGGLESRAGLQNPIVPAVGHGLTGTYRGEFVSAAGRKGTVEVLLQTRGEGLDTVWTAVLTWTFPGAKDKDKPAVLSMIPEEVEVLGSDVGYGFGAEDEKTTIMVGGFFVVDPSHAACLTGFYLGRNNSTLDRGGTFIVWREDARRGAM